jgi:hypothetical protein
MADEALELLAGLRLDNGRAWGDVATDWQLEDARAVLAPGTGDPLLHWLGRPKGGSKTTDVAGIALAWLRHQSKPLDEAYVIASDGDQAARLLKFAAGLINRTPHLSTYLEVQSKAIINRSTQARVVALAADAAGAEGLLSPLILVDELPQWADTASSKAMWDSAYSSITKVRGMRFVVIGHAGVRGSWQHKHFLRFQGAPLWRVHDVPGPLEWVDREVLADQEATLLPMQFARRHLNVWSDGEDRLTTSDALRACVALDGPLSPSPGVKYAMAVDLGIKSDRTVAVIGHLERVAEPGARFGADGWSSGPQPFVPGAGHVGEKERIEAFLARGRGGGLGPLSKPARTDPVRVVLDRIEVWQGSKLSPVRLDDVEAWVLQAHRSFNRAPLVLDPWQAVGMAQRLREQRVEVEEFVFSSASTGRLGATLHALLRDGALALPDDPDLLDELANVRLVERTPGVVRLDHDAGRHDDRAVALAMLSLHLLSRPPVAPGVSVRHRGREVALRRGR